MLASGIILVLVIGYCVFLIWRGHKKRKENKGKPGCAGGCAGCSGCSGCGGISFDDLYKSEKEQK